MNQLPDALDVGADLVNSLSSFCKKELGPKRFRAQQAAQCAFEPAMWRQLGEMGWLGACAPEEFGGLSLSLGAAAQIAEHLAEGLLVEPYAHAGIFSIDLVSRCASEGLRKTLLPSMISGEAVAAVAWQEEMGEISHFDCATEVRSTKSGMELHGRKLFVPIARFADGFIVTAAHEGDFAIVWVDAKAKGVSITNHAQTDGSEQASVEFDGVAVPSDSILSRGGGAKNGFAQAYAHALVIASAELVGASSALLSITVDYLKTREQFGKKLGSFQALQHRAVDLYTQHAVARILLREALQSLDKADAAQPSVSAKASKLKARSSDAALLIAKQSIQLHGGIGFTDDCDVGLYVKRILVMAARLGNGSAHRERYARLMPAYPAAH